MIWSATTRGNHAHAFVTSRGRSLCGGQERLAIVTKIVKARCPQCERLEKEREQRAKGATS